MRGRIGMLKTNNVISINTDNFCALCGESGAMDNRLCLSCSVIKNEFKVPRPADFFDDLGREIDYILAPELARIGRNLIANYQEDFGIIADADIDYFWKRQGGASGGKNTLGKCKKVSGELKYYSNMDFLVWLAADHCFSLKVFELTALVFHELKHAYRNQANGKYEIKAHDLEVFNREIEIFGAWKVDIAETKLSFDNAVQAKLF